MHTLTPGGHVKLWQGEAVGGLGSVGGGRLGLERLLPWCCETQGPHSLRPLQAGAEFLPGSQALRVEPPPPVSSRPLFLQRPAKERVAGP